MKQEYAYRAKGKSVQEVFVRIGEIDSNPPKPRPIDFDYGCFLVCRPLRLFAEASGAELIIFFTVSERRFNRLRRRLLLLGKNWFANKIAKQ